MYILYKILGFLVFLFFILPYYGYRLCREKGFGTRFRQSMGLLRRQEFENVINQRCIWIHGASVGEIVATSPLVKEIKKIMPERKVLVSAFTVGGYNMARQIIPEADAIIYFPLDLPWVAESVVRRVHPGIFMPVETELWPNFPAGHPEPEHPCYDGQRPYFREIRQELPVFVQHLARYAAHGEPFLHAVQHRCELHYPLGRRPGQDFRHGQYEIRPGHMPK
jgi:hypothetical protein